MIIKTYICYSNGKYIYNFQCRSKLYNLNFVLPCVAKLQVYASFKLLFVIPFRNEDSMNKIKQNEWFSIVPFLPRIL